MNAANEIAVEAFLDGQIGFMNIAEIIQSVMNQHHLQSADTLQQVLSADAWARQVAVEQVVRLESEGDK